MEHSLASSTRSRRSKASMLLLEFMGLLLCMYYSFSNEGVVVLASMGRSLRAPNENRKVIEDIDSLKQCSTGERVPCIVNDEGEDGLMKKSLKAWTLLDVSSMDYFFCCRGCKKPCISLSRTKEKLNWWKRAQKHGRHLVASGNPLSLLMTITGFDVWAG
jgi:hypothetical protein